MECKERVEVIEGYTDKGWGYQISFNGLVYDEYVASDDVDMVSKISGVVDDVVKRYKDVDRQFFTLSEYDDDEEYIVDYVVEIA